MTAKKYLVKTMLMSILTTGTMMSFTACSSDDEMLMKVDSNNLQLDASSFATAERTVLVYLAGKNNLSESLQTNLEQMKAGSRHIGNNTLLAFVRRDIQGEQPWLVRVSNGELTDSLSLDDMGISTSNMQACNPELMEQVLKYAFNRYPANEYGLVLGGHSTGWLIEQELGDTRAFGVDEGDGYVYSSRNKKWINVPTLARVLEHVPHLKYIFADCCNFMCLETMYELRNVADYIIGSPAEIPAEGAPYDQIIPAMFEKNTFCTSIIDIYHRIQNGEVPLSVVKTSAIDQLASATRYALDIVQEKIGNGYADTQGLIHYGYSSMNAQFNHEYNLFYDAGDFFRSQLPESDYQQWKQALDEVVIEKRLAKQWRTCMSWSNIYSDFEMTEEKYHGVSMYIPQDPNTEYGKYYARNNEDIKQLEWYQTVGW
jgi:hypothetical protein